MNGRRFLWFKLLAALLCVLLFPIGAGAQTQESTAEDLFLNADVVLKETDALWRLSDDNGNSFIRFKEADELAFSTDGQIQGLYLSWYTLPKTYTLEWQDANGATLRSEQPQPFALNEYREAPEDCCGAKLVFPDAAALCGLNAYGEGTLPGSVQNWSEPTQEPAAMLICGYPGDELLFFGGLVPTWIHQGVPFAIAYMSAYSRERQEEALSALWSLGYRQYPIFLGIETNRSREVNYLGQSWKYKDAVTLLCGLLQTYRPQTVVSFAPEGEPEYLFAYRDETKADRIHGEAQTALTGMLVSDAIAAAEKGGYAPLQYAVKGLGEGTEQTDLNAPLGMYAGKTANEVAQSAYDACFDSLRGFRYKTETRTDYRTVIGNGQLLEGIAYTPLYTPVPNATPTPEPTEAPTAAPSAVPTPTSEPEPAEPDRSGSQSDAKERFLYIGIGLFVLLTAACVVLKRTALKKAPVWTLIFGALVLLGAYAGIAYGILRGKAEPALAPESAITAEPSEAPTPEPTEAPTEEPTETPDVTQNAEAANRFSDELFTAPGEAEQVSVDTENGKWSYKSESLSIEINRFSTDEPLVWFVAEIYMRNADAFRPLFGNEGRSGRTPLMPWKIARLNHAVLLLTGDNMLHMDSERKGAIIRDGRIYSSRTRGSVMAWDPQSLAMVLFPGGTYSAEQILESGYENTFAFGPILLKDGEIAEHEFPQSGVAGVNPRCGIGMIEPGHFIAIVVDGRRPKYSVGVRLERYAEMFKEYGCTDAFNMDGGVSACMIFMGEQLNSHGNIPNDSKQRHMPDAIGIGCSTLLPTINDPIYNDGIDLSGKYD